MLVSNTYAFFKKNNFLLVSKNHDNDATPLQIWLKKLK